jgi:uncharacterized protein
MTVPRFILDHSDDIAALCHQHRARRLELFGSATRSDFSPDTSDLDFVVDLPEDQPPGGYADAFFGLKQGLERLFDRPVDLLTDASLVNPYLRQRINAERVAVYGA